MLRLSSTASKPQQANPELYVRIAEMTPYFERNDVAGLHHDFPAFNACYRGVTPIQELARTGNHDFVKWLISDEVGGNQYAAITGYAEGGYVAELDALMELNSCEQAEIIKISDGGVQGASPTYFIKHVTFYLGMQHKIKGLARAGDVAGVAAALAESSNAEWFKKFATQGYAEVGNVKEVDLLIADELFIESALLGYALGGFDELVNNLISRGYAVNFAIIGYAMNGEIQKANALSRVLNHAYPYSYGLACGGHLIAAKSCLEKLYVPGLEFQQFVLLLVKQSIVKGLAHHKHLPAINPYLHDEGDRRDLSNSVSQGFATGGYLDLQKKSLEKGARIEFSLRGCTSNGYLPAAEIHVLDNLDNQYQMMIGCLENGNIKLLFSILLMNRQLRKNAFNFAGQYGRINIINMLLQESITDADISSLCTGLMNSDLPGNTNSLRRLFATLNFQFIRNRVVSRVLGQSPGYNIEKVIDFNEVYSILDSAINIRRTMQELGLNYTQASALRIKGVRSWILSSRKLQEQGLLNSDTYYLILWHLTKLSRRDIDIIYKALCINLLETSMKACVYEAPVLAQYLSYYYGEFINEFFESRNQSSVEVKKAACQQKFNERARFFSTANEALVSITTPISDAAAAAAPAQPDESASAAARRTHSR